MEIVAVADTEVFVRTQHEDRIRVSALSVPQVLAAERPERRRLRRGVGAWPKRERVVRPKCTARGRERETYCAIDFEAANTSRDSACAVALLRVEAGEVVARRKRLIRPPRGEFLFSWLHGITEEDVADAPTFPDVWLELEPLTRGIQYFAAHNAGYDQSVIRHSCHRYGLPPPQTPFACTVRLAREVWGIRPTSLPDVCVVLDLPLCHHDPLSDAEAVVGIIARSAETP